MGDTSYIGRQFSNPNGADKIFMSMNDSVERALSVSTVHIPTGSINDSTEEFLQTTGNELLEYQVRVNKKRIPANGAITTDAQMYSHTMNSINRLGDCKFGHLVNFIGAGTAELPTDFPSSWYVTDLTRGVFGYDGSNAIILRPGDLEVELSLDNGGFPVTYFVYLEHQKVLKIVNGSLMDAE